MYSLLKHFSKILFAVTQSTVETKTTEQSAQRKFSIQSKKEETVVEKLSEKVEVDKAGQKVKKVEVLEKKPKVGGEAFFKVQLKPTKKVQVEKVEEKKKPEKVRTVSSCFEGLAFVGFLLLQNATRITIQVFHFCQNKLSHYFFLL